jgi:CO/xanthine dehydrogenase Mo-binding subunit
LPREAHAAVVRSPHAHARLRAIDVAAARAAPGVLAVLTGADLAADGVGDLPNPLGAKGVGEAGTVGALAALLNAVNDALAPLGVRHLDMPVTPSRVWRAIREARATPTSDQEIRSARASRHA